MDEVIKLLFGGYTTMLVLIFVSVCVFVFVVSCFIVNGIRVSVLIC